MQVYLVNKKLMIKREFRLEYIYLLIWLCLHLSAANKFVCMTLLVVGLINMASIMVKLYNFQPGLILSTFIAFYLLYLIPVFFFDIPIASHYMFNSLDNYKLTLSIFVLFIILINLFLKKIKEQVIIAGRIQQIRSYPIFLIFSLIQLSIIVHVLLTATAIGGDSSYDQYISNLEHSNGLWEYFYIFYIISFLFMPNRYCKGVLWFVFIAYVYVSITRGYRIQMIQMAILFFILFLDGKMKNYYILIVSLFGLVAMELYGIWKLIGSFDLERIISSYESFDTILVSNQTEVFYSSTGVLSRLNDGHFDLGMQLSTLSAFILNFIWPSGLLWKGSRVLDYMYNSDIGGGGFCFGYFYFWFRLFGVGLIAYFVSWNLNNRIGNNVYKIVYLILFISLCPRWFAYEPTNHLVRLPLTLLIILVIILLVFKKNISLKKL